MVVPCSPLCLQVQWLSLHIAGPARCPRVDKPHPASVPRPLPARAVTGRSLEMIAQAVRNCSSVTDRNYGQGLREMGCCKPVGHPCIWYDPAPNSYTEQNDPCAWLILGIPRSRGEQPPIK
jgi:hypothetical protein